MSESDVVQQRHHYFTFLNNILAYAQALQSLEFGPLTADQARMLEIMIKNCRLLQEALSQK